MFLGLKYTVKNDVSDHFFIGRTKCLDILDSTMVTCDLPFKIIKSKEKIFSSALSD